MTAQASRKRQLRSGHRFTVNLLISKVVFKGVIGTIGTPFGKSGRGSVCHSVGPLYVLQETRTPGLREEVQSERLQQGGTRMVSRTGTRSSAAAHL